MMGLLDLVIIVEEPDHAVLGRGVGTLIGQRPPRLDGGDVDQRAASAPLADEASTAPQVPSVG